MLCRYFQKTAVIILAAACIFFASGCAEREELVIPPLPTYSDELPEATVAPAAETPSPSPVQTDEPVPTPSPAPTASPSAAPTPTPAPTPEADVPVITISGETLPQNMVCYNVATLHGIINTDRGRIIKVWADLLDSSGKRVQYCHFDPYLPEFSLAGTVNAELKFAWLEPGNYYYIIRATVEYNGRNYEKELINHYFTIYSNEEQMRITESAGNQPYVAKITQDTSNAGLIWNFFVTYLDNPYGAAGILANIDVESQCEPGRLQGDFTPGFSFSTSFTEQVDGGQIGRDAFVESYFDDKYGPGYGLCQWSFERKYGLYDLAKERGTSVGDLDTQCIFIIMELEMDFPELFELLKTTDDARKAAREFFWVFEQGAEMGMRQDLAEDYLVKYALNIEE